MKEMGHTTECELARENEATGDNMSSGTKNSVNPT
jgi:hypothetical protein